MADPADLSAELRRTHPLEAWADAFAALPDRVQITVDPFVAMADVRVADPESIAGLDLPAEPNTWVDGGDLRAIWLGPDEWLVTSATDTPELLLDRVRAAVAPLGGSAVNVSAQRITLRLTGDRVRDVLAKSCAIDLHPRVFGRGRSAQTTLGLAAIVLLGLSDAGDDYLLLVRSSFAGHLAGWLLDASLEYA